MQQASCEFSVLSMVYFSGPTVFGGDSIYGCICPYLTSGYTATARIKVKVNVFKVAGMKAESDLVVNSPRCFRLISGRVGRFSQRDLMAIHSIHGKSSEFRD